MDILVNQRVRDFMVSMRITEYALSKAIGTAQSTIHEQFSKDGRVLSTQTLCKLFEAFPEIDANWVMTGRGKSPLGDDPEIHKPVKVVEDKTPAKSDDLLQMIKAQNEQINLLLEQMRIAFANK